MAQMKTEVKVVRRNHTGGRAEDYFDSLQAAKDFAVGKKAGGSAHVELYERVGETWRFYASVTPSLAFDSR